MIRNRILAFLFLAASTAASAVTVSVAPSAPTTADTLVLEVNDLPPCAFPAGDANTMSDGRVIRVFYNDGVGIQCLVAEPRPMRIPVGRLPAGTYRVDLVPVASPGTTAASVTVTVMNSTGASPYDDYSGHYVTNVDSEGVTVWQQGNKAFITFLYAGADGKPDWVVIPDGQWGRTPDGGLGFTGSIWAYQPALVGGGTGRLFMQLGFGYFMPSGRLDGARLVVTTSAMQQVDRSLTRLRF